MSSLIACSNCWYNALQGGAVGSSTGYCVEHRTILRRADETTCGRLMRKDLLLQSAICENSFHAKRFGNNASLKLLANGSSAENEVYQTSNLGLVNGDPVVRLVTEYGEYNTKIESLAQLRSTTGPRAELAMLSLARGYTKRCVDSGGAWTSGLHLVWWTRQKLEKEPVPRIQIDDLRYHMPISIERQIELSQWLIMMMRIIYITDIAFYAQETGDPISSLADLAEEAAVETGTVSLRKLKAWTKKKALPRIDNALSRKRYGVLSQELHSDV